MAGEVFGDRMQHASLHGCIDGVSPDSFPAMLR